MAEKFGADIIINLEKLGKEKEVQTVMNCIGSLGADLIFEVYGNPDSITPGVKMLRPGGRYLLLGALYPDSKFKIDRHDIITKYLRLTGMHNYDAKHLGTALDFVHATKDKYPFKKLVGPQFPLTVDGLSQAMKSIESGTSIRPAILA